MTELLLKHASLRILIAALALVACLAASNCGTGAFAALPTDAAPAASPTYVLSPDDEISIVVLGHPEFSISATLLPDGTFNFPVIGSIHAAGLTVPQLTKRIADTLVSSGQLNQPQVNVTVVQSRARKVSVIGSVKSPGSYDYKDGWRLLDVLAACGGIGQDPQLTQATLVQDGGSKAVPIDLVKLLTNSDINQNVPVDAGDILMVQTRAADLAMVQVIGEVMKPGQYIVSADGSSILSVLAQAGGATLNAALTDVQIMHAGHVEDINVRAVMNNLDTSTNNVRLYPGDVMVVKENKAQVSVIGEVNKPGQYSVPDGDIITIATALSYAGGLTDEGDRTSVDIVHLGPDGKPVARVINMESYVTATNATDTTLKPGDLVFVPSRKKGHGLDSLGAVAGMASILRLFL